MRNKKILVSAIAILISLSFTAQASTQRGTSRKPDIHIAAAEAVVGEIYGTHNVVQTFKSNANNMSEIDVLFATFSGRKNTGTLSVSIDQAGKNIFKTELDISKMKDNSFIPFKFSPISNSAGKSFAITLSSPKATFANCVTAWVMKHNVPVDSTLTYGGKKAPSILVFNTFSN